MRLTVNYIWVVLLIALATGCDDKIEIFEPTGSNEIPAAIELEKIKYEALPGQILLKWETPEGEYSYLQIKYYDPLAKKDVWKVASKETTEMLIDNTRARFGDYIFYFQTFNRTHKGSQVQEVKAKSGTAPTTITVKSKTKIDIAAEQLSTNAQEPTEGAIKNLVDGNEGTFFHTRWSSPQIDLPHWIQIDFNEPHENFIVYYKNRKDNTWTTSGRPSVVELQISTDTKTWETVATLSSLPNTHSSEYTSGYILTDKKFTSFRFLVTATTGNTKYFNLAEFAMYDIALDINNPETAPLD